MNDKEKILNNISKFEIFELLFFIIFFTLPILILLMSFFGIVSLIWYKQLFEELLISCCFILCGFFLLLGIIVVYIIFSDSFEKFFIFSSIIFLIIKPYKIGLTEKEIKFYGLLYKKTFKLNNVNLLYYKNFKMLKCKNNDKKRSKFFPINKDVINILKNYNIRIEEK